MDVKQFIKSLQYALRGIRYVYMHEQNIRLQTAVAVLVCVLGYLVELRQSEWVVVLLLIALVIMAEVLNSVMERFIDIVKPRYERQVQVVKDMLAAMVMLAAITSLIIGTVIFWPHVIELLLLR